MDCTHGLVYRRLGRAGLLAAALCAAPAAASAQAWVPPAGVGAVTIIFQNIDHTGHLLDDGSLLEGYDSVSRGLLLRVDYALTDRLSITAGLPYIGAKYLGPLPSFFELPVDECFCWNHGWQDLSVTSRYNLVDGAFALTPSVSFVLPARDYGYFGEAVVGRNLRETRLGLDVGQRLDVISPRLSVSVRYTYAFVEQVLDLPNNRSNTAVSTAVLLAPRLSAGIDLYWQRSHGGLRSPEFVTDGQWAQFDRILKDNSFHLGGGFGYSLPRLDVFASYMGFVSGTDTHAGRAVTVGISWPFELP